MDMTHLKDKKILSALALVVVVIVIWFTFTQQKPQEQTQTYDEKWTLSSDGVLSYPLARPPVKYTEELLSETAGGKIYKIKFQSRNATIYSLLTIPKRAGAEKLPGVVLLPGAGVTKESEQKLAGKMSALGFVVLTLDQRGIGETGNVFIEGEPPDYAMLYDALRAFDLLKARAEVDSSNIIMIGGSMGGRFALIATAIEPNVKGVIGISTSGYDFSRTTFTSPEQFLVARSIDPNNYIGLISPRKVVLIHSTNDNVIPISLAQETFSRAKEPRAFYTVACNIHGFCEEMAPYLEKELRAIAG
ncbi:MAG: alpha/beta fold hydrolase [Candidatus Micrarchaeota archaeon]